ncbi:MAG TPA: ComEA family DNA-binding protein [Gaiellaceae bacterium]|jgi:competence protein ComEA
MEPRRLVLVGIAVAVAIVLALHVVQRGPAPRPIPVLRTATHARTSTPSAQLVVDVAGAVRRPGLYHLAVGTRIADALAAAGGATARADVMLVNLAAPLADGEQVLIPVHGEVAAAGATPSATAPLDLNTASAEQLDALPGVGPATAQKIIDYRQAHGPFRTVEELEAVPGIGPSKVAQLKGLVIP